MNEPETIDNGSSPARRASEFILLREATSRYDDLAGMLATEDAPVDGLARVLCIHSFSWNGSPPRTAADIESILRSSPVGDEQRLLAMASARMCEGKGSLWCLGEVRRVMGAALQNVYGAEIACHQYDNMDDFLIFNVPASEITWERVWPRQRGDYGPRLFALRDETCDLAAALQDLESLTRSGDPAFRDAWYDLRGLCTRRDGIRRLCGEATACVVPDGEHFRFPSVQSIRYGATALSDILCDLAASQRWKCRVVDNGRDEWRELFARY